MRIDSLRWLAPMAAGLVLFGGSALAQSNDGQNRHVKIINETSHTMVHFYASNVNTESWEEDILGRDVLRVGGDVVINIDDGTGHCLFDFKAVFDDGDALVRRNVNVCRVTTYRYAE
ncbi:MAG TPA: hypothetical protein VII63_09355 [Caulobacteraceae bacterium]